MDPLAIGVITFLQRSSRRWWKQMIRNTIHIQCVLHVNDVSYFTNTTHPSNMIRNKDHVNLPKSSPKVLFLRQSKGKWHKKEDWCRTKEEIEKEDFVDKRMRILLLPLFPPTTMQWQSEKNHGKISWVSLMSFNSITKFERVLFKNMSSQSTRCARFKLTVFIFSPDLPLW